MDNKTNTQQKKTNKITFKKKQGSNKNKIEKLKNINKKHTQTHTQKNNKKHKTKKKKKIKNKR